MTEQQQNTGAEVQTKETTVPLASETLEIEATQTDDVLVETSVKAPEVPSGPIQDDVNLLLDLILEFSELLTTETNALRLAAFKTVDGLQARKKELAQEYQNVVVILQNRKMEIAQLEKHLRDTVTTARTQFTKILHDNLNAIESVKASSKRIVDRIIESAREAVETKSSPNYNATGYNHSGNAPVSISIDQQF